MSKFKKIAAVLLSAVMLVYCFAVQAGADSIADTAKSISSGKSYSNQIYTNEEASYKITASKDGNLIINLSAQMGSGRIYVFDSNGNEYQTAKIEKNPEVLTMMTIGE